MHVLNFTSQLIVLTFFRLSIALTLPLGLAGHASAQDDGQVTLNDPRGRSVRQERFCPGLLRYEGPFPGVCGVEDRSSVSGILGEICAPQNTSSTVSSSTSATSSAKPTSAASAGPIISSHTEMNSAQPAKTTPEPPTPVAGGAGANTVAEALTTWAPTTDISSTLVVVQTVELSQTSDLTSGTMTMEGGIVGVSAFVPVLLAMAPSRRSHLHIQMDA
ncbi:hypothetical protein BDN70DRAFT_935190 [Pholiota conissans]|uniref:Uncharacterized protein n=1 Tax=Pholiota conissans TaxID=109636 RepID=A0A9P5YW78_9AGAR|nr:hypothetical protein BDN70DRAFT_935190 [Pholiota conissans]